MCFISVGTSEKYYLCDTVLNRKKYHDFYIKIIKRPIKTCNNHISSSFIKINNSQFKKSSNHSNKTPSLFDSDLFNSSINTVITISRHFHTIVFTISVIFFVLLIIVFKKKSLMMSFNRASVLFSCLLCNIHIFLTKQNNLFSLKEE